MFCAPYFNPVAADNRCTDTKIEQTTLHFNSSIAPKGFSTEWILYSPVISVRPLSSDVKMLVATHKKPQTLYFELGASSTCITTKVALMLGGWGAEVNHESTNVRAVQNVCMVIYPGWLFPCKFFLDHCAFRRNTELLSRTAHTAKLRVT